MNRRPLYPSTRRPERGGTGGMCKSCGHVHKTSATFDPATMRCLGDAACQKRRRQLDPETIEFWGLSP